MNAKEYLMRVKNLNAFINAKLDEKTELDKQMTCLKSVQLGDKVKSSCVDGSQKTIDKIIDLKAKIDEEIDNLVDLKEEVREKINQLSDNRFKSVLIGYYINDKTFEAIAEAMNYSNRQIQRLHELALEELRKVNKMS